MTRTLQIFKTFKNSPPKGFGLFIDTETTGLNSIKDEVIEISMVLFKYSLQEEQILNIEEIYTGLREPNVPISIEASSVNGLTLEKLKGLIFDDAAILRLIDQAELLIMLNLTKLL